MSRVRHVSARPLQITKKVSFAKESYKTDDILQKRLVILPTRPLYMDESCQMRISKTITNKRINYK